MNDSTETSGQVPETDQWDAEGGKIYEYDYGTEQPLPPWEPFDDKLEQVDRGFVRKSPSQEAIQKMDQRLEELGDLLGDSNINYHVDGALNISLRNGAAESPNGYIGEHKDVDISVEVADLKALEDRLREKDYGLFITTSFVDAEGEHKALKRVSYAELARFGSVYITIAAIRGDGKIILEGGPELNMIDVHLIRRDTEGRAVGVSGVLIPEEWTRPQVVEFHGRKISVAHPAEVLYYKLHQGRNYDVTDAEKLIETGCITKDDIYELERVCEAEFAAGIEKGRKIIEDILSQVGLKTDVEGIFEIIRKQPDFEKGSDEASVSGQRQLAQAIFDSPDRSVDSILKIAMDLFKIEERNNQKRQFLTRMRQKLEDIQEIKQAYQQL